MELERNLLWGLIFCILNIKTQCSCFSWSFKISFQLNLALPVSLQRSRNAESSHLFFSSLLLCDRISVAWRQQMARQSAHSRNGRSTVRESWASSVAILCAPWPSLTPSLTTAAAAAAATLRWLTRQPAGASTWPPARGGAEKVSFLAPHSATFPSGSTARSAWSRATSAAQ